MKKNRLIISKAGQGKAQSILEYTLIIATVVAALMAMNVYVQRSVQANLKMIENQVNARPN